MRPRMARLLAGLTLVAAPALVAADERCERALSKASAKFVGASFKSAQRCLLLKGAGKLPADACRLAGLSTKHTPTDRALAHAEAQLAKGLGPCPEDGLAAMGFANACPGGAADGAFTRGDLNRCIATTHMAAVQALLSVQFPQGTLACGDGVVQDEEDCDPVATPPGCEIGEVCVPAGRGAISRDIPVGTVRRDRESVRRLRRAVEEQTAHEKNNAHA